MSKMQRNKGANAEREVVRILNEHGFAARRGQVFNHEPDIVSDLPFHFEVKRQETLKINDWWKQAESAAVNRTPLVIFRRNNEQWKVVISLTAFLELVKEAKYDTV